MSLSFPRTDILTNLPLATHTEPFRAMWRQEVSRTANGRTIVKDVGPLLWRAQYSTVPLRTAVAGQVEADLLSLGGGVELFHGYDPRHPFPASDKVSTLTGVTVTQISGDRRSLKIGGLPSSFVLTKGDWISINDGTNLHLLKVLETVTASGGVTPFFDVTPGVRAAITTGDTVKLRYASARFQIEPDSLVRSPHGGLHESVSFSALQVIL